MKTGLKSIAQFALFLAAAAAPALAENPPMARTTLSRTTLPKTTLIVLADWHTQIEFWPLLESALQQEAASGLAPINGSIEIVPAGRGTPGPVFPSRIEIEPARPLRRALEPKRPAAPGPARLGHRQLRKSLARHLRRLRPDRPGHLARDTAPPARSAPAGHQRSHRARHPPRVDPHRNTE